MPILRRDEAPDPLGPHLLYLWQRRLWILVPAIAVFVLTYLAMRLVAEEYVATGSVYVNQLTMSQDRDEALSPATVAQLLESSMLLRQVRDDYAQAFNVTRLPEFEKFAKRFKVKTDILQDTSVRKDISPVIALEVQSDGTSQTRYLMESWIRNFIKLYGNVSSDEAVQKRDTLLREESQIEDALEKADSERAKLRTKLALQEKLLAQTMDILAPADLPQRPVRPERSLNGDVEQRSAGESSVQVLVNSQQKPVGLLSRLADVQVELRKANADGAGTSSSLDMQSEAAAISGVIRDTETSITQLQGSVASMQSDVARLDREIEYKRSLQDRMHMSLNRFSAAAALATQGTNDEMPAGGDIRAISMPVQPELRVWPKRTFVAAGAAAASVLLIIVALLMHRYLQSVALRDANKAA